VSLAPTSLTVTSASATAVALAWAAPSGPAPSGYTVYRQQALAAGAWGQPVSIGTPAGLTFTDTTGAAGSTYLYQVSATTGGIESPASNGAAACFVAPAVTVPPVFASQLNAFFTGPFAQAATYTRFGFAPVTIQVIYNAMNQELAEKGNTANSSRPTATAKTSDVAYVSKKDTLAISGVTYYIRNVGHDGEGMTVLTLSKDHGQ
jgi:hypothetical protein